jgi:transcription initiation factor TFIID subunit 5
LLEDSVEEQMEKALAESDKIEAESNDADAEDNKARKSFVVCNISIFSHCVL